MAFTFTISPLLECKCAVGHVYHNLKRTQLKTLINSYQPSQTSPIYLLVRALPKSADFILIQHSMIRDCVRIKEWVHW